MKNSQLKSLTACLSFVWNRNGLLLQDLQVLMFIWLRAQVDTTTRMTDLVQSLRFGTGPTVQSAVKRLTDTGLISVVKSERDGRTNILKITDVGQRTLQEEETRLTKMMKG